MINMRNIRNIIINIIFIATGTLCTGMLTIRGTNQQMMANTLLALLAYGILAFVFQLPSKLFVQKPIKASYLLLALMLSWTTLTPISQAFHQRLPNLANQLAYIINWRLPVDLLTAQRVTLVMNLMSAIALLVFFYWLQQHFGILAKSFIKNLDIVEKTYLIILLVSWSILIFLVFNQTNAFYSPQVNGHPIYYDVIYTTDTGIHLQTDVYQNLNAPENDIRQPLFGLYALPFAAVAQLAAKVANKLLCTFASLTGLSYFNQPSNTYPIICNLLQITLLGISAVLLTRLMDLSSKAERILFLCLLTLAYPFLLFALNMEQYIFALFWMIMFIYESLHCVTAAVVSRRKAAATASLAPNMFNNKSLWYIGATGSLLTSGILFPLLSWPISYQLTGQSRQPVRPKLLQQIKPIAGCALHFLLITTLAGQLPLFITAVSKIKNLLRFAGTHIDFATKLNQYTHFIASCFTTPKAGANFTAYDHVSYQLDTITSPNWLGLAILLLAIFGFFRHRHKPLAKLCLGWIIFSFILLVIVGWGTLENGQILYSLYFSWAFICLSYMAIIKSIKNKTKPIALAILLLLILLMTISNIWGLWQLIEFGITYYPINL